MDPVDILHRHFAYPAFRPGQEELVRAVLAGRDALGILPTGGGKSVCYQVPALLLPGLTLCVSPLVSLMSDQVDRARRAGIAAERLTAERTPAERERVLASMRAGQLRLLLVSPERLAIPRFRALLGRTKIGLLAIDEAHCISEWGHDFRPEYLALGSARALVRCPVLALTATATPAVRAEIARVLALDDPVTVVGSFDRPNLSWHVLEAKGAAAKYAALGRLFREQREPGGSLVYAGTRRAAEAVRDRLAGLGLCAEAYHAGLEATERARVQDAFMAGRAPLVVATNAFGMGVDRADVRLVVHWQLPGSLEGYYQEAGRAGRDGDPARCVALHDPEDAALHRGFVDRSHPHGAVLRRVLRALVHAARPGRVARITLTDLEVRCGGIPAEALAAALRVLAECELVRPLVPLPDPSDPESSGTLASRTRSPPHRDFEEALPEVVVHLPSRRADLAHAERLRAGALARIAAVAAYATASGCRRRHLLGHFGEVHGGRGEGPAPGEVCCDRCLAMAEALPRSLGGRFSLRQVVRSFRT